MPLSVQSLTPARATTLLLHERVVELKHGDALAPVTVLLPSRSAALATRRALARLRGGSANVRCGVVAQLAEQLGAPPLTAEGRKPLTAMVEHALVRRMLRDDPPDVLAEIDPGRALVTTLARGLRRLRDLDLDATGRAGVAARGPLPAAAVALLGRYEELLREHRLYDSHDLHAAAAGAVEDGAALDDVGAVVVHLPLAVQPVEAQLLRAIGKRTDVVVSLLDAGAGGPREAGSAASEMIRALGPPVATPAVTDGAVAPGDVHVTTAPSATEEVRAVVRRVLADCEAGVPLHRMAILHNDERTYADLLRDTLAQSGIPFTLLGGRPLAQSHAARGLMGLLRLRESSFSRVAVVTWLAAFPRDHGDVPDPPVWDRLSRRAAVVRGATEWERRLNALARANREEAAALAEQEDGEARRRGLEREAEQAERIAARIVELEAATRPPVERSWAALSAWCLRLLTDHVEDQRWGDREREAADTLREMLGALPALAGVERDVTVEIVVDVLDEMLERRRLREGLLGDGVTVGDVAAAAGMRFERLHVVGLCESSYPSHPQVDPLLPGGGDRDLLDDREQRVATQALAFATVCTGVDPGGVLGLSTPVWDGDGRPLHPSRWLVAEAVRLAGARVTASELRGLAGAAWLTAIRSPQHGVMSAVTPRNVGERRMAAAAAAFASGHRAGATALAGRDDLPLRRALRIAGARRSDALTASDGNLGDRSLDPDLPSEEGVAGFISGEAQSATRLETWATCPFKFLLERLLHVEQTEVPEGDERWTLSALERGSAVHTILERFFRELVEAGRPRPEERYGDADRERLRTIAEEELDALEGRGQTGHPLVWRTVRASILDDLETLLQRDEEMRGDGSLPHYVEQPFGFTDEREDSWAPVKVTLGDGTVVRLRGYIDRIDVAPSREVPVRARVIDYKTGKARPTAKELDEDPVIAGTKLQLALYARALRAAHPELRAVDGAYWYASTRGGFTLAERAFDAEADARLDEALDAVARGIAAGSFRQAPGQEEMRPNGSTWHNCAHCPFDRVCPAGRDHVAERKSDDPAARMHTRLTITDAEGE